MTSRDLLVWAGVVAVAAAAGACAHGVAKTDPKVTEAVASFRTWIAGLPRCPPSQQTPKNASFGDTGDGTPVAMHGQLTLATDVKCTLMKCDGACCNTCFPAWVVRPGAAAAPADELAIQRSGMEQPLAAVMRDCLMNPVREQLPPTEIFVSGFREGRRIIRATMCVIEAPPPAAPAPKVGGT